MLACKLFHPIARHMLWAEPKFKHVLVDLIHLKALAKLSVPIRRLKLSQLGIGDGGDQRRVDEVVDFVGANFPLDWFYIDTYPVTGLNEWLSVTKFRYFVEKLPVKQLSTRCFLRSSEYPKFLSHLEEMKNNCPVVVMDFCYAHVSFSEEERLRVMTFVEKRFPDSFRAQVRRDAERVREGEASRLSGNSWPAYFIFDDSGDEENDSDFSPESEPESDDYDSD